MNTGKSWGLNYYIYTGENNETADQYKCRESRCPCPIERSEVWQSHLHPTNKWLEGPFLGIWLAQEEFGECVCVCVCARVSTRVHSHAHVRIQSCPALCKPLNCSPSGSSVLGIFQQYWGRLPFPTPGDLLNPGIEPVSVVSPALAGGLFTNGST